MAHIELKNISKVYYQKTKEVLAVDDLSLSIKDGAFVALLGPSGCGKSSTLRMIAGLEKINQGSILFDGEEVNDLSPSDRDVAMAFESYGLYPHMTVYENLSFCLRVQGLGKNQIDEKIHEVSRILRIEQILQRKPMVLSGGQQQRVSLGRALIRTPKVSLLDEPLSHIGTEVRDQLRTELKEFIKLKKTTAIFVTHDQQDALSLADYVAVMLDGKLQQFGISSEVLLHPKNKFVAEFIGEPPINLIDCQWRDKNGKSILEHGSLQMFPPDEWAQKAKDATGDRILLGIRPNHLFLVSDADSADDESSTVIRGKVIAYEWVGNKSHIAVEIDGSIITVIVSPDLDIRKGSEATLRFYWNDICALSAENHEVI